MSENQNEDKSPVPENWESTPVPMSDFITGLQEEFGFGKTQFVKKPLRSVMNSKNIIHQDNLAVVTKQQKGHYLINPTDGLILPTPITFHSGNPAECISGVSLESLLAICKDHLIAHNSGEFNCSENTIAIECCSAAIEALTMRVQRREKEGKLGTQEL